MPLVSQAQARWAYANQGNKTREGAAARDFIAASPGGVGSVKKLPKFKKPKSRMPSAQPFGSLAPGGGLPSQGAGHYMGSVDSSNSAGTDSP